MYSFIFRVCVGRNQATLGRGNNRVSSWLVEFTRFHNQLALYNSHRSKGNGIRKCKYKQSCLVTSLNKFNCWTLVMTRNSNTESNQIYTPECNILQMNDILWMKVMENIYFKSHVTWNMKKKKLRWQFS